jgi:hypothetical protein
MPPLRSTFRAGVERAAIQEARLQPFLQQVPVQRNVGEQPVVTYPIQAGFNVAFEELRSAVTVAQDDMRLFPGIGTAATGAEPLGVPVGPCLFDGIEPQQIECLLSAIGQGGNP